MKPRTSDLGLAALLALLSTINLQPSTSFAQGTAFTYQGRLNDNGNPANGTYDLRFRLFDAPTNGNFAGGVVMLPTVGVSNGLFTVTLAFNNPLFDGSARWLDIGVRTNGSLGSYTNLVPRQAITPAPYAVFAASVGSGGLVGTYTNAVTISNAGNAFVGRFSGSGGGLTNVDAATLGGLSSLNFWQTTGNFGAAPGQFLGTSDTNALEIKVGAQRALRIEYALNLDPGFSYSPNIVGGYPANIVSNGFVGAVIGGGGYSAAPNRAGNHFATVVGGDGNTASGIGSTAMGEFTTAKGDDSTAMGSGTTTTGRGSTAMGVSSTASGFASTAIGYRAKALHDGSFVWADGQGFDFASTGDDQFCIRAGGGVQLSGDTTMSFGSTLSQKLFLYGADWGIGIQSGVQYSRVGAGGGFAWYSGGVHNDNTYNAGGGAVRMKLDSGGLVVNGALVPSSDRNVKENFEPLNPREVLDKVAALPISKWSFKEDSATRHLGPMAQDFYAAFGVGPDDKHIATVDADGVALAAIQGLNQKLEEKEARIAALEKTVAELKTLMQQPSTARQGGKL